MNIEQYRKLLYSLCEITGLDCDALQENGAVTVDGTDMQLLFDEQADPESVHIRVDLGARFEEVGSNAHRALLVATYDASPKEMLNVSVHPQSGHIVITSRSSLDPDMTGENLAIDLQRHARSVREWWSEFQLMLIPADVNQPGPGMIPV
jgi:hypothetical protein